jgi:hypothetical protein
LFLLSTNDKTIKLWKIYEKKSVQVSEMNIEGGRAAGLGASHPDIQELLVRGGERRRGRGGGGEEGGKGDFFSMFTVCAGILRNEMRHRKSVETCL